MESEINIKPQMHGKRQVFLLNVVSIVGVADKDKRETSRGVSVSCSDIHNLTSLLHRIRFEGGAFC